MKKLLSLLSFLFILNGCAAQSGVVLVANETFMVSRQADTDFSGLSTLRVEALEDAYKYCSGQNRFMRVDTITEFLPPDNTRGLPRAEVQFMCLEEADEKLTGSQLNMSSDKVIEIKLNKPQRETAP